MTRSNSFLLILAGLMALGLLAATPGLAVQPDEVLDDPALEARAREISKDIRCLVCQNQSIDDSNADLARDLRIIVRERLVAGDSDREVKRYLVDRYGDYVLLTPPMSIGTALLWGGPFVLVLLGALGVFVWFRNQSGSGMPKTVSASGGNGLSAEEQDRLAALMAEDSAGDNGKEGPKA